MTTLKKFSRQQLFLPIVCVLLVLAVNIVYDVATVSYTHLTLPTNSRV